MIRLLGLFVTLLVVDLSHCVSVNASRNTIAVHSDLPNLDTQMVESVFREIDDAPSEVEQKNSPAAANPVPIPLDVLEMSETEKADQNEGAVIRPPQASASTSAESTALANPRLGSGPLSRPPLAGVKRRGGEGTGGGPNDLPNLDTQIVESILRQIDDAPSDDAHGSNVGGALDNPPHSSDVTGSPPPPKVPRKDSFTAGVVRFFEGTTVVPTTHGCPRDQLSSGPPSSCLASRLRRWGGQDPRHSSHRATRRSFSCGGKFGSRGRLGTEDHPSIRLLFCGR
eukprot:Selendium_serpulae@DN5893_c1_g1_i1.p1